MVTSQHRYICGGVCGFEACLQEFLTEKELDDACPPRRVTHNQPSFLLIDNLPRIAYGELYNRLDRLCDNTGGKIVNLDQMMGVIRFSTLELCIRAQKRLNNHYLRQGMCPIRARFSPDTIQTFR
ncbi:Meiosis arrest female protein 1-like [Oopsacas minuta]|uniref:Meiosis arrest female protein 1-like n=1 Tax=Oopsacas minuta TaxID=111878 RepID=A0AAV7JM13_9METZ|nr:Meiosis arrest female protein 1-like [Oopsacas minuta]